MNLFAAGIDYFIKGGWVMWPLLACSIGASVCELVCFVLVGIGFGVDSIQALVCGYVVATLFAMFSLTPQGVGFVETAVTVAFTTFGQSSAAGLSIGLVYRSIVFWMPFLIGAVLIQMTSTFKREKVLTASKDVDLIPELIDDVFDGDHPPCKKRRSTKIGTDR